MIATDMHVQAFEFVRRLAGELSTGEVDLPSFPDIAMRVRRALEDEQVPVDRVARIASAEAGLAARIFVMANSAALGVPDQPVTDLKAAVTRIGLANVRTAALAFALTQLRKAAKFRHIAVDLERLWKRSTRVASLCRVLATRTSGLDPDLAMLTGLLHNIGCVYILARGQERAELLQQSEVRDMLLRDWSGSIGRSIAENWGFPESVFEAIGQQHDLERTRRGSADLGDILAVALVVVDPESLDGGSQRLNWSLGRLSLNQAMVAEIVAAGEAELTELQAALAG